MIETAAKRWSEDAAKKIMGVQHWVRRHQLVTGAERMSRHADCEHRRNHRRLHWPGRQNDSAASSDCKTRSAPRSESNGDDALAALKAHLAKHGYGDIEVNMTGGYDPNRRRLIRR